MKNSELILAWNKIQTSPESDQRMQARLTDSLNHIMYGKEFPARALAPDAPEKKVELVPTAKHRKSWRKYASVAAAVLVLVGLTIPAYHLIKNNKKTQNQELTAIELDQGSDNNAPMMQRSALPPDDPTPQKATAQTLTAEEENVRNSRLNLNYQDIFEDENGGGREAYFYQTIEEREVFNPLDLGTIKDLPLFKNPYYSEELVGYTHLAAISEDDLRAHVDALASSLGLNIQEYVYLPNDADAAAFELPLDNEGRYLRRQVLAIGDEFDLFLNPSVGEYSVLFKEAMTLPEGAYLNFYASENPDHEINHYDSQRKAIDTAFNYLFEELKGEYLPKEDLQVVSGPNSFTVDGFHIYDVPYFIHNPGESPEEKAVNAEFQTIRFMAEYPVEILVNYGLGPETDYAGCYGLTYSYYERSESLGTFPIITSEEAVARLKQGEALPTYDGGQALADAINAGEKSISAVELCYRFFPGVQYFAPYYRILIAEPVEFTENPNAPELEIHTAFYIPAIIADSTGITSPTNAQTVVPADLKPITINRGRDFTGLYSGIEAFLFQDATETKTALNFLDTYGVPEVLPVFQNPFFWENLESNNSKALTEQELQALADEVAAQFDFSLSEYTFFPSNEQGPYAGTPLSDDGINYLRTAVFARGDKFNLFYRLGESYTLYFKDPVDLPEGSYITNFYDEARQNDDYQTQRDSQEKAFNFLLDQYYDLIPFDTLEVDYGIADYNIEGMKFSRFPVIRNTFGESTEEIYVRGYFETATFVEHPEAEVWSWFNLAPSEFNNACYGIRFSNCSRDEEIGRYPIISIDEAITKLNSDDVLPFKEPNLIENGLADGSLTISRSDLVYRNLSGLPYYIPYYRFLLEEQTPFEGSPNLNIELFVHQAVYVPAISSDYLIVKEK